MAASARLGANEARGGNAHALHEFLGVDLAAFELRVLLRGTNDGEAAGAELIHDAGDQRDFGADYSEVGPQPILQRSDNPSTREWWPTCAMPGLPGAAKI